MRRASRDKKPLSQIAIIDQATIDLIASQVTATDITGKVDKVTGKSLVSDTAITDLTDGGETTLHTHPAGVAVIPTSWGKYF